MSKAGKVQGNTTTGKRRAYGNNAKGIKDFDPTGDSCCCNGSGSGSGSGFNCICGALCLPGTDPASIILTVTGTKHPPLCPWDYGCIGSALNCPNCDFSVRDFHRFQGNFQACNDLPYGQINGYNWPPPNCGSYFFPYLVAAASVDGTYTLTEKNCSPCPPGVLPFDWYKGCAWATAGGGSWSKLDCGGECGGPPAGLTIEFRHQWELNMGWDCSDCCLHFGTSCDGLPIEYVNFQATINADGTPKNGFSLTGELFWRWHLPDGSTTDWWDVPFFSFMGFFDTGDLNPADPAQWVDCRTYLDGLTCGNLIWGYNGRGFIPCIPANPNSGLFEVPTNQNFMIGGTATLSIV